MVRALVGPTAAGKSAIGMAAAKRLGAEVIAVDAFTVYRGMNVGTAKPSPGDRARIPHHMVDVLEPERDCTVQWFQAEARRAIERVHERGRPALLVGGSGLYFRAVVDPLEFPPTDAVARAALHERWRHDPLGAHTALRHADPASAARIAPGNLRRTVRALEVLDITGRPFSEWRRVWDRHTSIYEDLTVVGVDVTRADLDRRIDRRIDAMLAAGLVDECRALAGRALSSTARQAIGYAEIWAHLSGACGLEEAVEAIRVRTRRFAVRQQRWFASDPRVRWEAGSHALEVLTA